MDPAVFPLFFATFGSVAGELLKDAARRHVTTFFGDQLKKLGKEQRDAVYTASEDAWGAACELILDQLRVFLSLEPEELADAPELEGYRYSLRELLKVEIVAVELLSPFSDREGPSAAILEQTWRQLCDTPMPEGFSWGLIATTYRRKAERNRVLSPELQEQLRTEDIRKIRGLLESQYLHLSADRAKYAERMRQKYQILDFAALREQTKGEPRQVLLHDVFIPQEVREALEFPELTELPIDLVKKLRDEGTLDDERYLDPPTAQRLQHWKQNFDRAKPRAVLEVLRDTTHRRIVFLGGPGSGKSTLTKYLLLSTLRDRPNSLPLLMELRDYNAFDLERRFQDFLDYWHFLGSFEGLHLDKKWLLEQLKQGPSLVLFDGLDEIFDARRRERITDAIAGFATTFPRSQVLVTSRPVGYQPRILRNGGFRHFSIEDFNQKQVRTFIKRWFGVVFPSRPQEAAQRVERVLGAVARSRSIDLLAGNPMLLTIMVMIARFQELPRERWRFYAKASEVLCHHWDINRRLGTVGFTSALGPEDKTELLKRIAFRMQSGTGGLAGNVLHADDLEQELGDFLFDRFDLPLARRLEAARELRNQLRDRNYILCLRGPKLYGFVHRTFLEYFCARELADRVMKQLDDFSLEQLWDEHFRRNWDKAEWGETLRLICGMLGRSQSTYLVSNLLEENAFGLQELIPPPNLILALKCLAEVRRSRDLDALAGRVFSKIMRTFFHLSCEPSLRSSLEDFVLSLLDNLWPPTEAAQILRGASFIGSENESRLLSSLAIERLEPVAVRTCGDTWLERLAHIRASVRESSGESTPPNWIWDRLHDAEPVLREAALRALAQGWAGQPSALELIRQCVVEDLDAGVRSTALGALVQGWPNHPVTLYLIRQCINEDSDEGVRIAALGALIQGWADRRGTLDLVRHRVTEDPHEGVRIAALGALVQGWSNHPITLGLICQSLNEDPHGGVRIAALSALVQGWPASTGALDLVLQRVTEDSDEDVRVAALSVLAQGWPDDPGTLDLVLQSATEDPHALVRSAALSALAQGWPDDPGTFNLIRQCSTEDSELSVRCTALGVLVRGWPDDPGTRDQIRQSVAKDPRGLVRRTALGALMQGWSDAPSTLDLIRKCVTEDSDGGVRSAALRALAQGWRDDPVTFNLIRQSVTEDSMGFVRRTALDALAQGWSDDPGTLDLIRQRVTEDSDASACGSALGALVRGWPDDPGTLDLVLRQVTEDSHESVKSAALRALAVRWPDHPETLDLIRLQATEGSDWAVRRAALLALAAGWPDDPGTLNLIRQRITEDSDKGVRSVALRALAVGWSDHSGTLELIRQRVTEDSNGVARLAALTMLVKGWSEHPGTPRLIEQCITEDSNGAIQEAAQAFVDRRGIKHEPFLLELELAFGAESVVMEPSRIR